MAQDLNECFSTSDTTPWSCAWIADVAEILGISYDGAVRTIPAWLGQCNGANRAVKCRSCRGWDTMRMPGSWAARLATRVTTSIT